MKYGFITGGHTIKKVMFPLKNFTCKATPYYSFYGNKCVNKLLKTSTLSFLATDVQDLFSEYFSLNYEVRCSDPVNILFTISCPVVSLYKHPLT